METSPEPRSEMPVLSTLHGLKLYRSMRLMIEAKTQQGFSLKVDLTWIKIDVFVATLF
jgi:hypothetical protein